MDPVGGGAVSSANTAWHRHVRTTPALRSRDELPRKSGRGPPDKKSGTPVRYHTMRSSGVACSDPPAQRVAGKLDAGVTPRRPLLCATCRTRWRCNLSCGYCSEHDDVSPLAAVGDAGAPIDHIAQPRHRSVLDAQHRGGEPPLSVPKPGPPDRACRRSRKWSARRFSIGYPPGPRSGIAPECAASVDAAAVAYRQHGTETMFSQDGMEWNGMEWNGVVSQVRKKPSP